LCLEGFIELWVFQSFLTRFIMPHRGKPIAPPGQSETSLRPPSMQEGTAQSCGKNLFPNEGDTSSFGGVRGDAGSFEPKGDDRRKRGTSGDFGSDRAFKKVKEEPLRGHEGNLPEPNDYCSIAAGSANSGAAVFSQNKSKPLDYTGTDPKIRQGREPLKKRKKHLDVLRRNRFEFQSQQTQVDDVRSACQVSPVSFASNSSSRPHDDKLSEGSNDTLKSVHSSESESPDQRDSGAVQITPCPPARVVNEVSHHLISDFPQVLHYVLSESMVMSQVQEPVLHWLPHGRSWRISGWDALRETILPRFFPTLCHEGGSSSIDAFLWNVRCWGFEEVADCSGVGAYAHDHFVRSMPNLWKDMKCSIAFPTEKDREDRGVKESGGVNSARKASDPILRAQSPSISQSNTIDSDDAKMQSSPGKDLAQFWGGYHQSYSDDHSMSQPHSDYHCSYQYAWQYHSNTTGQYNQDGTCNGQRSMYESPHGANFPSQRYHEYKEVRPSIRSGRGGSRLKASSRDEKLDLRYNRFTSHMNKAPSFPVSQRGRGTRHPT